MSFDWETCRAYPYEAAAEIERLTAALKRECDLTVTLREAISWIEDQEPQIVEAARQKFNVEQSARGGGE